MNCEAYSTFEAVSSDHCIVSAKIRLSLRAKKPKAVCIPLYDWQTLLSIDDIRIRYTITVRNIFVHHTRNSTYDNFITSHSEAAVACIPQKRKVNGGFHGRR